MGIFDDLAMGFGLKPKTQDFVDRTARTIERTQGSTAASNYASGQTSKGFENNYTPSEDSVPVVQQSSSNDDNTPLPSIQQEMPERSTPTEPAPRNSQDPELPDEGLDMTGTSSEEPFRREGLTYVENNGKMVLKEAVDALEMVVGKREQDLSYDINGDGKVDLNDALGFIKYGSGVDQGEATDTFMQNFYASEDSQTSSLLDNINRIADTVDTSPITNAANAVGDMINTAADTIGDAINKDRIVPPEGFEFAGMVDTKYRGTIPSFTKIGDDTGLTIYADTVDFGINEGKTGYFYDDIGDDVGSAGTGGHLDADNAYNGIRSRAGNYIYHYEQLIDRGVKLDDSAMEMLNAALEHHKKYNNPEGYYYNNTIDRIKDTMNAVQNYDNYTGELYTITDDGAVVEEMPFFDSQDAENLKKLKRAEIDIALLDESGEYNEVYDLNNDGKVSLLDVSHLNMQYAGRESGGERRTDNFFNLMAQDFGTSIQGQQTQLADGVAAPVATDAEINMNANTGTQGYYSVTFNDVNGGSFNVLGRTVEEARAKARERGQAYIDNVMSSYNQTGQMTDEERQILRDAIGWSQAYAPSDTGAIAASTLNQYEIDNLLAPTFARDPITGQASTIDVSQPYNDILNSDLSDDAKKYQLVGLMGSNLTQADVTKYDLTGDGKIDQSDVDTAQTNYLRANNAIIQDPSQSSLWSYSDAYGVDEGSRYVNFNTSGSGNSIAQTNMGELFQEGDKFKFRTKDGLIAREFGNVQDAIRFVSPNAGYEFGKFSNEFGSYDSYSPYYFTDRQGERQDLSAAEIADIDAFRAQGMSEQQINDALKEKYDYRVIKDITGQVEGGLDVDTQTDMAFQGLTKPQRDTYEYEEPKTQDIYTRDEATDQQAGMFTAPAVQPQFMQPQGGAVNPATGTFVLGQGQSFAPSSGTNFALPTAAPAALSTGVLNAPTVVQRTVPATGTGSYGYTPPPVGGGNRMPYMAGRRLYNEGGVVPQQQLQSQGTFGGFKPQAMQRIANSLGYTGDMSGFEQYLNANPDKQQKMNEYTQKAVQMAKGGSVKKPIYANEGTYVSDPRVLGQQYIPQQDFSSYEIDVPVYDDEGNQTGTEKKMTGYNLQDVMAMQAVYPGLPEGATVVPMGVQFQQGQFVDPTSGQVYGSAAVPTALASTTQAGMPQATGANLMTAATGYGQMNQLMQGVGAAQTGYGPAIQAAQGQSNLDITAAQGQAYMMTNPMQRELQQGELISGAADAQKAAQFTEQIQAAQAEPSEKATVQGQLEGLMAQFEEGDTPAWASGAMRAAMGAMAARGLGASSLAGQAVVQAAMESALPVAMADAQTQAQFEQQNLSNRQQRAMLAAQQRAQFMGQEFDQAFQARVANASKISDIANMNFTAEQQIALENSRAANTMELANLSNSQAAVMAEAAAIANMDMANLNNRQQAAVQNAQNFLQVDMANLSNRQQSELFRAQQRAQALFTDQAALNAAAQFNASSQNQVDQFFASLASQTAQFNASQANAQSQFNAGQTNVIERFNTEINNQREQFNAQNRLIIDQSNAQWRREVATMDTAAVNRANELNAEALLGYSRDAYNNLWQYYRDNMEWAWTAAENEKSRMSNLAIAQLQADSDYDLTKMKQDYESNVGFGSLIGKILTTDLSNTLGGSILGDWFGFG